MPEKKPAASGLRSRAELRKINLFVLRKLHLLDETGSAAASLLRIAEDLVGLHAKRPQTPYLSLLARLPGLRPQQVHEALYRRRALLRAHCMRGTVHLLPLSQYETILTATRGQLDGMYRRAFLNLSNKAKIEAEVYALIESRGALSHAEIARLLPLTVEERDLYRLLNELCTRGLLVKATVRGSWRSSIYNYEILERWQPRIPAGETDVERARAALVKWYLTAYGPATLADICWWTGLRQAEVKKAINNSGSLVESLFFEALNQMAWMLAEELEDFENWIPPGAPQVNLLPGFDPYVMAYIERRRYIGTENYGRVFKGVAGLIEPVVTCDGEIVGTWKYNAKGDTVPLMIFKGSTVKAELLEVCARRTALFLQDADRMQTDWKESDDNSHHSNR